MLLLIKRDSILFFLEVKNARFTPSGGIFNQKADIYIEMIIDEQPPRKSAIAKKTWSPEWNEIFDAYVSVINFLI